MISVNIKGEVDSYIINVDATDHFERGELLVENDQDGSKKENIRSFIAGNVDIDSIGMDENSATAIGVGLQFKKHGYNVTFLPDLDITEMPTQEDGLVF